MYFNNIRKYRRLAALMTASVETTMPEAKSCNIDFVLQQMDGIPS
jgi:hypothetical protein